MISDFIFLQISLFLKTFRQYKEFVRRQFGISENFEAGIDVRALPDIVGRLL